jgi:peptide/nickel transport system permease protein
MEKEMSSAAMDIAGEKGQQRSGGKVFQRFLKNRLSVLGAVIVLFAFGGAILAPLFSPYDPNILNTQRRLSPPGSSGHFLGTDEFGRDLVSRLLWGARITLFVSITATVMALVAGSLLGLLSGFFMGWFDILVMRLIDILMAFPYFLLAITVIAALGPGLLNGMIAIAIVNIPFFTRIVRGVVLSIKEMNYVEAARALGANRYRIIGQHVLINCFSSIVVAGTLNIGWMITAAAGLSFLGLGVQPPTADWGTMIASGRQYISVAPHVATLPGLAIFFTVLGFNLLGDGLRDALDPRLKI